MAHENEGLPGLYREDREEEAIANAPDGVKENSKEINRLEKRIEKLEKDKDGN